MTSVELRLIRRRRASALTALLSGTALSAFPAAARDLPKGAQVAAGKVAIERFEDRLTVTQGSDRAIINWDSFSIGAGKGVDFLQPGSRSAVLNRVTGSAGSEIAGSLTGNGQIFLVNPNGIAITPEGTVRARSGFVASTLDIADDDFLAGRLDFHGDSLNGVTNAGLVEIGRGGYAALLGGEVRNDGIVAVPMGRIGLGSGQEATLDLTGDGFLQVALPTKVGTLNGALIENGGTMTAEGGMVVLRAATARELARQAINLSGVAEARSVAGHDGEIVLDGGEGGAVGLSGELLAGSDEARGGSITVTGQELALNGAALDVSGATGGGSIRVGGDYQGSGTLAHAATLTVDSDTRLTADALSDGTGGDVVLWSDDLTSYAGTLSARGARTGAGGNAEVSGKALLDFTGRSDLSGPGGFGTLLLDPHNITIVKGGTDTALTAIKDSRIDPSLIEDLLASQNVSVSTGSSGNKAGDITVTDPISWSSAATLYLDAAGSIDVSADIAPTGFNITPGGFKGGSYYLRAGQDIDFNVDTVTSAPWSTISLKAGGDITFNRHFKVTGDYARLVIDAADGGGDYAFGPSGKIDMTGDDVEVNINGSEYFVLDSPARFAELNSLLWDIRDGDYSGGWSDFPDVALVRSLDMSRIPAASRHVVHPLMSIFAGFNNTISDLTLIQGTDQQINEAGLFKNASGAAFRDFSLVDVQVSGAPPPPGLRATVGALVNTAKDSTFTNISVTVADGGTLNGIDGVGGFVADGSHLSFDNVRFEGDIASQGHAGSLVASGVRIHIEDAEIVANLTGNAKVGGLVGTVEGSSIRESTFFGTVDGGSATGGLAGSFDGSIYESNIVGNSMITGSAGGVTGGLVGTFSGEIDSSDSGGTVTGGSTVGGLVGTTYRSSTISGGHFDGRAEGTGTVGGIAGRFTGSIGGSRIDINAKVKGDGEVGGVVGVLNGSLAQVHSAGTITGGTATGGLVGRGLESSQIDDSSFSGTVEGGPSSGGIAGTFKGTMQRVSTIETDVRGTNSVGGLVGTLEGTIKQSMSDAGTVDGDNRVGGLVGLGDHATIIDSYAEADASGGSTVGGLVGVLRYSTVARSYALGDASGTNHIGGLAGTSFYTRIDQTYAAGNVSGDDQVGGLIGTFGGYDPANVGDTYAHVGLAESMAEPVTASFAVRHDTGPAEAFGEILNMSHLAHATSLSEDEWVYGGFLAQARSEGWDFHNEWAYKSNGYLPELTALGARVVLVEASPLSWIYGSGPTDFILSTREVYGAHDDQEARLADVDWITSARADSNAGYYGINAAPGAITSVKAADGSDIKVVYAGSIKISKADLDIYLNDDSKTYDLAAYSGGNGYSIVGLVNGDTDLDAVVDGTLTYSGTAQGAVHAGDYAISGTGLNADNYNLTIHDGTLSVARAPLTVTTEVTYAGGGNSKEYDGTLDGISFSRSWSGFLSEQDETAWSEFVTGVAANYLRGVGTHTVKPRLIFSEGASNHAAYRDYQLNIADVKYIIVPRGLTVVAPDIVRTYDGRSIATEQGQWKELERYISYSWGNYPGNRDIYIASDGTMVNASSSTPLFRYVGEAANATDAGKYALSLALTDSADFQHLLPDNPDIGARIADMWDTAAENYYIQSITPGTLTILPAALTITAQDVERAYGEDNGALTYLAQGLVDGDALTGALATAADAVSGVDDYAITQGSLSAGNNYDISFTGAKLAVTPRALTISASDVKRVYGDGNGVLSFVADGLVNGDLLSGALSTKADIFSDVGDYAITQGTLDASGNYDLAFNPGTLTVAQRSLTVTASDVIRHYGDANSSFTFTAAGLVNGDGLTGTLSSNADQATGIGDYAITRGTLRASDNYDFTFNAGTLKIVPRPLKITAFDSSRIYGDSNPDFGFSATGLVNGDTLRGKLSSIADVTSNVGSYGIGLGSLEAGQNYVIGYTSGTLTVAPRDLFITGSDASRLYGDANPGFEFMVEGLVNGDLLTGALSVDADMFSNVGDYRITRGTLNAGGNYNLAFTPGTLAVTPRALIVAADDAMRTYGDANPDFGFSASGLVNGDLISGTLASAATIKSDVGSYAIAQGSLNAGSNYDLTFDSGTLTIVPRPLTITALDTVRLFGASDPDFEFTVEGLVNCDMVNGQPLAATDIDAPVGTYDIGQGTIAVSPNYALTYIGGTLTVLAPQTHVAMPHNAGQIVLPSYGLPLHGPEPISNSSCGPTLPNSPTQRDPRLAASLCNSD